MTTAPFALAHFRDGDAVHVGLVVGDRIRALADDELGGGLNAFLADPDWDRLEALAASEGAAPGEWHPLSDVTLTAPVEPHVVLFGRPVWTA